MLLIVKIVHKPPLFVSNILKTMKKNLIALIFILPLVSSFLWAQSVNAPADEGASIVVLFRHGETDSTKERHLNAAGQQRAELLGSMLKDLNPDFIYSTDIYRTKETVEPLRKIADKQLRFYGLSDMQSIAEEMKSTPGTYVVSGHSNTTPDMVRLLGADPGEEINENEFDRLYIVTIVNGKSTVVLLRYGNPYVKQ